MNLKNLFIIALFLIPAYMYGQDTTYFDTKGKKVKLPEQADYYEVEIIDTLNMDRKIIRKHAHLGTILNERHYKNVINKSNENEKTWKLDGKFKEWYENGQVSKDIDYIDGKFDGLLMTYSENGRLKRQDNFEQGKLIDGKCFDAEGSEIKYFPYEVMPKFPGGDKELFIFLTHNVKYPSSAQKNKIQGRVVLRFVVDTDGSIIDLEIARGISPDLNAEALRVVRQMPLWEPGMQDGKAVQVKYTFPITFRL